MAAIREEVLLNGIEEIMKLHSSCISIIESMLPGMDEGSVADWKVFAKTLSRHWRCWGERAAELRQQLFGIPGASLDDTAVKSAVLGAKAPSRAQLELLLEQHRLQYSSLDSDAAARRDYRTMCLARTQLAEALVCEQKLSKDSTNLARLRLAS